MDAITKTWNQVTDLWGSLAASQRLSLVVVPVLLFGAFGYLLWGAGGGTTMTPLAFGKVMTDSELDEAEAVLVEKGLKEFRRSGNQLLVPSAKVEEYHGALIAGGGLPSGWAEEFEKKFDQSSVFTSGDQRRTMREIALAKEMRRWLRAIPEVVDGNVVWARSERAAGFSRAGGRVTATVTLKPRPSREISSDLAQSVRRMIANAVPDLSPADVVVFSTTGRVFEPEDENDPMNGRVLRRLREFSDMYRRRVESALAYIPGVLVTVHVDLDNVRRDRGRTLTVDGAKGADAMTFDRTEKRTDARQRPRGEPGAVSNVPQALATANGPTETSSDNATESKVVRVNPFELRETEYLAGLPTSVQVSVGVPKDYYENAVLNTGVEKGEDEAGQQVFAKAVDDFKKDVEQDVTATAARAIGTTEEKVSVTSYVRVDPETPELVTTFTDTATGWVRTWGGTAALAVFAAWALWMVARGGTAAADDPGPEEEIVATAPDGTPMTAAMVEEEQITTAQDELQGTVRDNPEVAAAVIGKWIREAQ